MTKLLTKVGAEVWAQAMMYKAVVKMVFLYGSEMWVVTRAMLTVLEGFHHQVARKIAVKIYRRDGDGGWECPPV